MKVGLKNISEISGFSLATVSNVLNNKKGVNEDTARKILTIAREIGYFKDSRVDKVKLVIYKKHGMVVDETPFFNELISGVESECRNRGLALEVTNLYKNDINYAGILSRILGDYSSAVLLLATELTEEDLAPFKMSVIPVALLDGWQPNMQFNSTIINNKDSVANAVSYLSKHGYTDFGYIKSSIPIYNFVSRYEGFKKGLEDSGLEFNEKCVVSIRPTAEGAYNDMMEYLKSPNRLPKIFLADNDIIALGAMKALKNVGVDIPSDVAIMGFDDMPYCEISSPSLSTIRVFKSELGVQGVRNLIDNMYREFPMKVKVSISTELVIRESILLRNNKSVMLNK